MTVYKHSVIMLSNATDEVELSGPTDPMGGTAHDDSDSCMEGKRKL